VLEVSIVRRTAASRRALRWPSALGGEFDHSKGQGSFPEGSCRNGAVFAGLALIAAALLAMPSSPSLLEVVVGSLDIVRRRRTGGENHFHALLVVSIAASRGTDARGRMI